MRRQFFTATVTALSLITIAACGSGTESGAQRTRNVTVSVAPSVSVLPGEIVASTSTSAWATPPTTPYDYVIVGMGDSFGSGEGNPAKRKDYARTWRTTRWWNADGSTDPEAAADCHRSSKSGFYKAVRQLKDAYSHFNFIYKNFACTGAEIRHLHSRPYVPETEQNTQTGDGWTYDSEYPNQLSQVDAWLREKMPSRAQAKIDAMYISIGGNDAGFAKAIESCITEDESCVRSNTVIRQYNEFINRSLNASYLSLSDAINSSRRYANPQQVVISEYPNFIKNENGQWCESDDYPLDDVTSNEWSYLWEQIGAPLLSTIRRFAATKNWSVAPMENAFERNVLCDSNDVENAWINNDEFAQDGQGNDMRGKNGLVLSMGMVHPNDRGYEAYANAIAPQLRSRLLATSTPPGAVTNFRVTTVSTTPNASGQIQVKFSWTPPLGRGTGRAKRSGYQIILNGGRYAVEEKINLGEGNTLTTWINPMHFMFSIAPCGQVLDRSNYRACLNKTEIQTTPPTTVPRGPTTTVPAGTRPGSGGSTTTTIPRSGTGSGAGSVSGS